MEYSSATELSNGNIPPVPNLRRTVIPLRVVGFTHRRSSSSPKTRMRMRKLISYTRMSSIRILHYHHESRGVIEGNSVYVICSASIMQFVIETLLQ